MKKTYLTSLVVIVVILIGFFAFKYWKSTKPCPANDSAGLFTKCKVEITNDPNDPLGIR